MEDDSISARHLILITNDNVETSVPIQITKMLTLLQEKIADESKSFKITFI